MQITNTAAALRPRSVWEAMDLGFVLAQTWWWPLYRLWLGVALPVFLISSAIGYDNPGLTTFLFWWFKPAYEQLPLIYLSRALFKQDASIKIYSWSSFKIVAKQLFLNLTFRRFSPIRSFTAAVSQLEGLSGRARSKRLESLTRNAPGFGQFTLLMLHFEAIFIFSMSLIIMFVMPENIELTVWLEDHEILRDHISNLLFFIAAGTIAPFFVAGGFSMYINRRTILEGWDIEIEFKRLQNRITSGAKRVAALLLPVILLPVLLFGACPEALAKSPQQYQVAPVIDKAEAKKTIDEIMKDSDFGHKETVKRWHYKGKLDTEKDKPMNYQPMGFFDNLGILFGQIGEVLLWGGIAVAIILLLYYLPGWLEKLRGNGSAPKLKRDKEKPNVLFGLNIEKDSLPEDISAAALALLNSGDYRQCLSLLYRASLSLLIHHHGLDVHDSHTEGECQHMVESLGKDSISNYFNVLTGAWVALAYGHLTPSLTTLQSLCQNWSSAFNSES